MSFSLYDATIPTFCQMLDVVNNLLDKAAAHCGEKGIAPETIIQARLAPEQCSLLPIRRRAAAEHSLGAIEGVADGGVFTPDVMPPPNDFQAALKAQVNEVLTMLRGVSP